MPIIWVIASSPIPQPAVAVSVGAIAAVGMAAGASVGEVGIITGAIADAAGIGDVSTDTTGPTPGINGANC